MEPAGVVRVAAGPSARALADPGSVYAIYLHHGRAVKDGKPTYQVDTTRSSQTIELRLVAGAYEAEWRDARSPAVLRTQTFQATGEWQPVASPSYSEDVVLLLRRAK